jgi:hypothetical protein
MSEIMNIFIGGPWDGEVKPVASWPVYVNHISRQASYDAYWLKPDRISPIGPDMKTVTYYPARFRGINLAITGELRRFLEKEGAMPDGSMTRAALKILYEAIHADHNDPTENSGDALERAFEFAEFVLEAKPDDRNPSIDDFFDFVRRLR